jgi:hypothetical protein
MSSLRQRTLWRVMLLLLLGTGLLALYNYHDSAMKLTRCTTRIWPRTLACCRAS